MFRKKITITVSLLSLLLFLNACSMMTSNKTSSSDTTTTASQIKPKNENIRLNFNKVKLGVIDNDGKGGTSLKELEALFGQPDEHTTQQGGDVTLDVYTWRKDETIIVTQLYADSTIAKSISNFRFIRENNVGLTEYDKIKNGMSFQEAIEKLGEPDVMSQAVSSDGEEISAIWSSGIKSNNTNANIQLDFKNNSLTNKSQLGLVN